MPIPYTPLAIANQFIRIQPCDHMKLQKLVYCANGWWLAYDQPPLVTERPQVWKFGPVFPSLYRVLKVYGGDAIARPQSIGPFVDPDDVDQSDDRTRGLIKWVWNRYGHLSGFALSDMTHKPGTAWYRVAKEHNFIVSEGLEIPNEYIAAEFKEVLARESGSTRAAG
jgi:uncharacterized phage-associated protein